MFYWPQTFKWWYLSEQKYGFLNCCKLNQEYKNDIFPLGINTMGLYRIGGVNSKVQRLMTSVFGRVVLTLFVLQKPDKFIYMKTLKIVCLLEAKFHLTQAHLTLPASKAPADMDLDPDTWDNKTITSGLKNYLRFINNPHNLSFLKMACYQGQTGSHSVPFRCLAEPLMTYRLHKDFIMAVSEFYHVWTPHHIHMWLTYWIIGLFFL